MLLVVKATKGSTRGDGWPFRSSKDDDCLARHRLRHHGGLGEDAVRVLIGIDCDVFSCLFFFFSLVVDECWRRKSWADKLIDRLNQADAKMMIGR